MNTRKIWFKKKKKLLKGSDNWVESGWSQKWGSVCYSGKGGWVGLGWQIQGLGERRFSGRGGVTSRGPGAGWCLVGLLMCMLLLELMGGPRGGAGGMFKSQHMGLSVDGDPEGCQGWVRQGVEGWTICFALKRLKNFWMLKNRSKQFWQTNVQETPCRRGKLIHH